MPTKKEELVAIAEANGYDGDAPKTIVEAVDAVTVALGGEAHGGTIAEAIRNLASNIGGGGPELGPLTYVRFAPSSRKDQSPSTDGSYSDEFNYGASLVIDWNGKAGNDGAKCTPIMQMASQPIKNVLFAAGQVLRLANGGETAMRAITGCTGWQYQGAGYIKYADFNDAIVGDYPHRAFITIPDFPKGDWSTKYNVVMIYLG